MINKFRRAGLCSTSAAALLLSIGHATAADTNIVGTTQNVNPSTNLGLTVLMDDGTMAFTADTTISPLTITLDGLGGVFDTNGYNAILNTQVIGSGSFEKTGAGTLTIKNYNPYTGATQISQGTLALGFQGNINQSSSVTVDSGAVFDISGVSGATIKQLYGAGSILLGDAHLNTTGGTFSGVISGNGSLAVNTGTLVLTGENTFLGQAGSGNGGVLQIGNGGATGSIAGNIGNNGSLVFDRSAVGGPITYGGSITGTGDITFRGGATYILTTSSSDSGAITIGANTTLQWGTGGAAGWIGPSTLGLSAGPITNNGALIIDRSSDRIYQGQINGTGNFTKRGTGLVALSNTNSYTGATNVEAGTLLVSGSTAASTQTTVQSGATLTGSGTIGKTNVLSGGILAPGNHAASVSGVHKKISSIGDLKVTGDLALGAGSFFDAKVDDQSHSDKVSVTGAANINTSAKVRVSALNGTDDGSTYAPNTTYTILTSTGGITGQFDSTVVENFAFLDASLIQGSSDIKLKLSRNNVQVTDVAGTANQQGAASALAGFDTSDPIYQRMMSMTAEEAQQAYDDISGEVHASGQQSIDQTFSLFTSSLVGGMTGGGSAGRQTVALGYVDVPTPRVHPGLAAVTPADASAIISDTAWITPLAGIGSIKSNGNAGKLSWAAGGLALGFDRSVKSEQDELNYGIGFGYLLSRGEVASRTSKYDTQGGFVGAHAGWTDDTVELSGRLAYGLTGVSTSRDIHIGAITRTATADYWTHTFGGGVEASYGFALTEDTKLKPVGTLDIEWSGHNGTTESGAGSLNASIASASNWLADAGIGLEVEHDTQLPNGTNVKLKARALYERALADTTPTQSLALEGNRGTQFSVGGAATNRDRLVLGAGFEFKPTENRHVSLNYAGTLSKSQSTHVIGASFGIDF